MMHTLEVDSVILEFKTKKILQDVYLKCETGKITGLLGRNGTGKTCLMNIIYGKLNPDDKSIRLDGNAIFNSYRNPEEIRYLPQFGFIPRFLSLKRVFEDFNLNFSDFVNYFPEFEKYNNSKLNSLSGGEQRIIEIYSILVSNTKFCMLDEPFSQVMPLHIETIKHIIKREKANKGILITDHLYKDITDISDNIYVINDGKVFLTNNYNDLNKLGYIRK